jgi:hypothetical protein
MCNIFNIMKSAAVAVLVMTLAVGCALEKDNNPSAERKDVVVLLDVSAGGMQTKAIDESAISTLRIYAFDKSGTLVGHTYIDGPSEDTFHVILDVPGSQPTLDVDFYVIANESTMYHDNSSLTLSENTSRNALNSLVYSSLLTTNDNLPLSAVVSETLQLNAGSQHLDGEHIGFLLSQKITVGLSRSLAKIGVYAAALEGTPVDPVINEIILLSPGRRNLSYICPAEDRAALLLRDASVPSLPENRIFDLEADGTDQLSNAGTVSKRLAASNAGVSVAEYYTEILSPFYLAEVPYGSTMWNVKAPEEGRPAVLLIKYSFGEGTVVKTAEINMPEIKRNTFYQIRCLIKSDSELLVDVDVLDWEAGEDHILDFDFPTHSDPVMASSALQNDGTYTHEYGTPATMYYSSLTPEKGAFSVDFNMSYPVAGKWSPSIRGASMSDYDLIVYKRGTTTKVDYPVEVTSEPFNEQWYTIKIVPKSTSNVGAKLTMSITYIPVHSGSGYAYLIQINGGEENRLAWTDHSPVSDDDHEPSTVDIVVTQIEEQTSGF